MNGTLLATFRKDFFPAIDHLYASAIEIKGARNAQIVSYTIYYNYLPRKLVL